MANKRSQPTHATQPTLTEKSKRPKHAQQGGAASSITPPPVDLAPPPPPPTPEEEDFEHLRSVVRAWLDYEEWSKWHVQQLEWDFQALPEEHQLLLSTFQKKTQAMHGAMRVNQTFCYNVSDAAQKLFPKLREVNLMSSRPMSDMNMAKVGQTIKQFVRDWSTDGAAERAACYGPLLQAVDKRYPFEAGCDRANLRVLCPGSGLGRLPWELARMGFYAEGNEFTYFMVLASYFILHTKLPEEHAIQPWALDSKNARSADDMMRTVRVPDVNPSEYRVMTQAGDFTVQYRRDVAAWDAVCTCFFLDTAANVLTYVEAIARMLKPGALWANLGPLLYHFSEMKSRHARKNPLSLELTYEELKSTFPHYGLELQEEKFDIACHYNLNDRGLSRTQYRCVFFTCKKLPGPSPFDNQRKERRREDKQKQK